MIAGRVAGRCRRVRVEFTRAVVSSKVKGRVIYKKILAAP